MKPPFKVGDRVRMKAGVRPNSRGSRTAVVTRVRAGKFSVHNDEMEFVGWEQDWEVYVHKDGRGEKYHYLGRKVKDWELETDARILTDHTADLLVKAYLLGDRSALRPLIDRLLELLQGT
jgi:hypothetical protein